jgi:peptide/nickel transport system substrate-binding protein
MKAETNTTARLAIGVHYEPSGVDPHINAAELGLQMTMGVFDTLVCKTPEGDYLPHLAESFEISPDERVYRFRLRRDVKFHDGTPFDAAAVKFSLDRAADPANRSQLAGSMLGPYQGSRVVDEHQLEIRLSAPYALLLDSLSQGWLAPVSPSAVKRYGSDFGRHPVGTGPFRFEGWIANGRITLRRNPDYAWAPPVVQNRGAAYLDEISFRFLPHDMDRTAALEEGAVNAVFYVPPGDIGRLAANPAFRVGTWPIRGIPVCMMMNIARPPTSELAVRQAINYAIDQEALVQQVFRGHFPRAFGPLSQFTLGYEPSVEQLYAHDLVRAQRLLQEAGWTALDGDGIRTKEGQRLELEFYALPVNYYPEFGRIVQHQLFQAGIGVTVRQLAPPDWIQAGRRGDHHLIPQGKYTSSPHLLSYVYHSRHSQDGYGWSKRPAEHRPGLDELLERGERALRKDEYLPIYRQVQQIVMEEALIAPLHCNTNVVVTRAGIAGLRFDAIGAYPYFHDTSIVEER